MKPIIGFFVAVIAVAILASYGTWRWSESRQAQRQADPHQWLHSELKITDAQHQALAPIELKFDESNRRLREQLRAANHELALAIKQGTADAPAVGAAVEKVHMIMGELQRTSIDHVYEMRRILTPAQGDRLLELVQQGLDGAAP